MMLLKDENLYYVGGVVRDEILGVSSFDIDFCYEGNAINFAKEKELDIIRENPNFGTVRVLKNNKEIDIASTRNEVYPKPAHLPVVINIGCCLKDDLRRRDFTINSMAKNTVTGCVVDYFNGLEDIENKKIRVLHDNSFIEDPSRILRALKFRIRFDFEFDEYTQKLQEEYLKNINYDMSFYRLKKELKETFNLNSRKALEIFINEKIYKLLTRSPEKPVKYNYNIQELINKYKPENVWLVYAGLFDLSNLELNSEEKKIIEKYQLIKDKKFYNDIEIYNTFSGLPLESLLLYAITNNESAVVNYLDRISKINVLLRGADLLKLGIPAGEIYKEIFNYVLEKKINMPESNLENEIDWVREKFL